MTIARLAVPIIVWATILSFPCIESQAAELEPLEALKACARVENTDERVACYDALGERVLNESTVKSDSSAVATAPPAVASPVVEPSKGDEKETIHGHVRSCQETSDGKWLFTFDSGEIWKQSGGRTRRLSDCDFDVVIRKDLFGHKMTIEGDDKTIRVRRHN